MSIKLGIEFCAFSIICILYLFWQFRQINSKGLRIPNINKTSFSFETIRYINIQIQMNEYFYQPHTYHEEGNVFNQCVILFTRGGGGGTVYRVTLPLTPPPQRTMAKGLVEGLGRKDAPSSVWCSMIRTGDGGGHGQYCLGMLTMGGCLVR